MRPIPEVKVRAETTNLLHWARTGLETPMYASAEARRTDIEERASRPYGEIVSPLGSPVTGIGVDVPLRLRAYAIG